MKQQQILSIKKSRVHMMGPIGQLFWQFVVDFFLFKGNVLTPPPLLFWNVFVTYEEIKKSGGIPHGTQRFPIGHADLKVS